MAFALSAGRGPRSISPRTDTSTQDTSPLRSPNWRTPAGSLFASVLKSSASSNRRVQLLACGPASVTLSVSASS